MNLFSVFYHLDRKVWLQWDYDIEKYDICGETNDEKDSKVQNDEDSDIQDNSKAPQSATGTARNRNIFSDMEDIHKIEFQNLNIVTEDSIKQIYILGKLVGH